MPRVYGAVRELDPTKDQASGLLRAVGSVRKAQNKILEFVKDQLENHAQQSWSSISLHTVWREHREDWAPWYSESSKENFQYGAERASMALANWSASRKGKRGGRKVGFPRFRRKGCNDSAAYTAAVLRPGGLLVHIPRIGEIVLKEPFCLPDGARITTVTVRTRAGRWFVSFKIREDGWTEPAKRPIESVRGIDAGIGDRFATFADGTFIDNPRFFRSDEKKLKRAAKALRRKKKGSRRRQKALDRVAVIQYRTACKRQDFIHKFTTGLVNSHDEIVIEDLELHGMKSSLALGKSVSDAAWGEVRRQFKYKCEWQGKTLTIVSKWFPSTKMCSACGYVNRDLDLSDRIWVCPQCGVKHDRDVNAAINLEASSVLSAREEAVRPDLGQAIGLVEARTSGVTEGIRL